MDGRKIDRKVAWPLSTSSYFSPAIASWIHPRASVCWACATKFRSSSPCNTQTHRAKLHSSRECLHESGWLHTVQLLFCALLRQVIGLNIPSLGIQLVCQISISSPDPIVQIIPCFKTPSRRWQPSRSGTGTPPVQQTRNRSLGSRLLSALVRWVFAPVGPRAEGREATVSARGLYRSASIRMLGRKCLGGSARDSGFIPPSLLLANGSS